MEAIDAAYLAGILDGEGCFLLDKFLVPKNPLGVQYRVTVTMTMCDKLTIDWICGVTGRQPRHLLLPSGRSAYKLDWRNGPAAVLIRHVLPYLRGKKEQARLCLDFNDRVAPGRGRVMTEDRVQEAERVRSMLTKLKGRNALRC